MADREKERERRMREAQERARLRREQEREAAKGDLGALLEKSVPPYTPPTEDKAHKERAKKTAAPAEKRQADRRDAPPQRRQGTRRRRRKMRTGAKVVLLLLVLLAVILCAGLSPLCAIKEINVTGNEKVVAEEIVAASGLLPGQNLFTSDYDTAHENIYNLPWISGVTISRRIPSTVNIEVTESAVSGYLELDGLYVAIDGEGKSIATTDTRLGTPVFTGIVGAEFEIGQPVRAENEESLKKAIDYIGYFTRYKLENVTSVDVTVPDDVIFTIGDKLIVHFGADEGIAYKMAYLKETLLNLPENANGVVDATRVDRMGKPEITYRPSVFEPTPEPLAEGEPAGEGEGEAEPPAEEQPAAG